MIDEYLSENGFSEEFILQTDEQTKRALYEEGGVFDSDSELNISPLLDLGQDWEGFTATLTASHLSYEDNVSTKFLVFNLEMEYFGSSECFMRCCFNLLGRFIYSNTELCRV